MKKYRAFDIGWCSDRKSLPKELVVEIEPNEEESDEEQVANYLYAYEVDFDSYSWEEVKA